MHDIRRRVLREAVRKNTLGRQASVLPPCQRRHPVRHILRWKVSLVVVPFFLLLPPSYIPSISPVDYTQLAYIAALVSKAPEREAPSVATPRGYHRGVIFPAPEPVDFRVFSLDIKKIVVDPGHGGKDKGAMMPPNIVEKEVALDIGHRLRRLLEGASFEVLMTRKRDEMVAANRRAAFANAVGADLFVSIHVNWFRMSTVRGAETYYLGPTDDSHVLQLAARENRASGYTLADFRRLLENVYLDVRRTESHRLARAVQHQLNQAQRTINPTLRDRGVKMAPFLVLATTQMPAVLAEVTYLSNREEARLLATPEYRQLIARALFRGIRAYTRVLNYSAKKGN